MDFHDPTSPSQALSSATKPAHPLERGPSPIQSSAPRPPVQVRFQQGRPILSYVILGSIVAMFVLETVLHLDLTALGAKDNDAIIRGELWRLLTPIFLHNGVEHLLMNGYALFVWGPQVERAFRTMRFALVFFLAGVSGSVFSFLFSPYLSVGASGALFGLIGALIPFYYRNRKVLRQSQGMITNIIYLVLFNLVLGLLPRIDNWAHLGGLVGGLVLGWWSTPLYHIGLDLDNSMYVEDTSSLQSAVVSALFFGAFLAGAVLLRTLSSQFKFVP